MNYQDNKRATTAEDLRIMFNLDSLSKDRKAISNARDKLTRIESEQENIIRSIVINLSGIIENQSDIFLWFFDVVPTLSNEPAVNWSVSDYPSHEGDIYYNRDTGYVYIFESNNNVYSWVRSQDASLIQSMALTNAAIDTADHLRKVFLDTPNTPYDVGDWYLKQGDLYICQTSKTIDELYDSLDFIIAAKYTSSIAISEMAAQVDSLTNDVAQINSTSTRMVAKSTFNLTLNSASNTSSAFDNVTIYNSNFVQNENNYIKFLKAGTYRITVQSRFNDCQQQDLDGVGVLIDNQWGDNFDRFCWGTNNSKLSLNSSFILTLNANQKIGVEGYCSNGGSVEGIFTIEYLKGD